LGAGGLQASSPLDLLLVFKGKLFFLGARLQHALASRIHELLGLAAFYMLIQAS
jgi:hypothetical protein